MVAGRVELLKTAHDEEVGLDPLGRRPDAVSEAEHREWMAARRDDFQAFRPAYPVRHLDRIEADVFEAVLAHLVGRPLDGGVEVL